MDINLQILRVDLLRPACWFVQVELEQTKFPSKERTREKQRTDLSISPSPQFERNTFIFTEASLAHRLAFRFGAVEVTGQDISQVEYIRGTKIDPRKCVCQGIYTLVLTQKMISQLRDSIPFKEVYKLQHPDTQQETGSITVSLTFQFNGLDERIIENEREISRALFEPYENDPEVISKKLRLIETLLPKKQKELDKWLKKNDKIKNALRSLGVDVAMLKKQKDALIDENNRLEQRLFKLQNVEDYHIQIDMLSTSASGLDILKGKLERIILKLKIERRRYQLLTEHWLDIEAAQRKAAELRKTIDEVKEASQQCLFHTQRYSEQLPNVQLMRSQVRSMNEIITNLESQLTRVKHKYDPGEKLELDALKHQKAILQEKFLQMQLLLSQNNGILPLQYVKQYQKQYFNQQPEIERIQNQSEELIREIELLGSELSKDSKGLVATSDEEILQLNVKLQAAEIRVNALQREMDDQAIRHGKEVAEYTAYIARLRHEIED